MPILRVASVLDELASARATRMIKPQYEFCTYIHPILDFWGAKFPKIGDSVPRTLMNHRAKFDAASFILGKEIRNRTNTQIHKK